MVTSKSIIEQNAIDSIARRIFQANQIIKNPEFLKVLNEIVTKSEDKRESFASSEFESLDKRGVQLKNGTVINFKVPSKTSKVTKRKIVTINITIPDVGIVSIRSLVAEQPTG